MKEVANLWNAVWVRRPAGLLYSTALLLVPMVGNAFALTNPLLNSPTLEELLWLILNAVVFILFPILILALTYAGFLLVSAQGNPTKIADAKRVLVWTVIGATILLGAKTIALMIENTAAAIM